MNKVVQILNHQNLLQVKIPTVGAGMASKASLTPFSAWDSDKKTAANIVLVTIVKYI